jgi:vancomycin resistance protein YoaR
VQKGKGPRNKVSGRGNAWFWLGGLFGLLLILLVGFLTLRAYGAQPQPQVVVQALPKVTVNDEAARLAWRDIALPRNDSPKVAYGPRHFYSQADLDRLGVVTLLGTFTQEFDAAEYRTINVGRSAELLNGKLLAPGEVFSMNQTIKQRTPENGYTEGIVIGPGGLLAMSYGGGVSITTAATWGAAFFSGLEPIEQRAHSIWIDRYTPGLEATVSWGSLDLRFRNTTNEHVLISAKANDTSVTVSMWGTPEYDKVVATFSEKRDLIEYQSFERSGPDCVEQVGQPGFRITVTRDFIKGDKIVKSEDFVTAYQPSPAVTCA